MARLKEVVIVEKKKMGRPTDAPKIIVKRARMSESDVEKLKEYSQEYNYEWKI